MMSEIRDAIREGTSALALCGQEPVSATDFAYAVRGFLEALAGAEPYPLAPEVSLTRQSECTLDNIRKMLLAFEEGPADEISFRPRLPFEVEGDQVTGRVLVRAEMQPASGSSTSKIR